MVTFGFFGVTILSEVITELVKKFPVGDVSWDIWDIIHVVVGLSLHLLFAKF